MVGMRHGGMIRDGWWHVCHGIPLQLLAILCGGDRIYMKIKISFVRTYFILREEIKTTFYYYV
jgi:hypothetical protein